MIRHALRKLVEAMQRPGLLGVKGIRREKSCYKDVAAYFQLLGDKLPIASISKLAVGINKEASVHAAEATTLNTLRILRPVLVQTLVTHLFLAYKEGWIGTQILPHPDLKEAAEPSGSPLDFLGQTGERAADWAAAHAADLIVDLDNTTLQEVKDLVAQAIEERLGVNGLAKLLREAVAGMSRDRAMMIATTEMNTAISTATLEKLSAMNVEYKQWIPVDDPCPICDDNASDGAIPVDENFSSGDDAPPAHPNCRCAVAGARPPEN